MIASKTFGPLIQRPGVRQFVKFGIVGASSSVINFGILNLLYHKAGFPLMSALTVAFLLSVCNGFIWNRRWTFKERRSHSPQAQSLRFLAVNIVAFLLNNSIVTLIVAHFTSSGGGLIGDRSHFTQVLNDILTGQGKAHYGFWLVNGALAAATSVVVFWNYFANRHWTFKK
jgi:putative flippase GtrA